MLTKEQAATIMVKIAIKNIKPKLTSKERLGLKIANNLLSPSFILDHVLSNVNNPKIKAVIKNSYYTPEKLLNALKQ
jgi:hypothetical protein